MILGVGLDSVEIERITKILEQNKEQFVKKIFTPLEIDYCEAKKRGSIESYAARFAAKEAMAKALGCGIGQKLGFKDIEVYNDSVGKPSVRLLGEACKLFENFIFHLSLTHTQTTASAVIIIEKSTNS